MFVFLCENNEEAHDLSYVAQSLEDETVFLDIRSLYCKEIMEVTGFSCIRTFNNSYKKMFRDMSFFEKVMTILKIQYELKKIKPTFLLSGIPVIHCRVFKQLNLNITYISYIRSVFMPRIHQKSWIWRLLNKIGLGSILPFKADKYFVTGQSSKEMLRKLGCDRNVFVSGSISLSKHKVIQKDEQVKPTPTGIIYLTGAHRWHGDEELESFQTGLLSFIKNYCLENDLEFKVRIHPRDTNSYDKYASDIDTSSSVGFFEDYIIAPKKQKVVGSF